MSCYWWSTLGSVFIKTLADNPAYHDFKIEKTRERRERKQDRYGEHFGKYYSDFEAEEVQKQTTKVERMPFGSTPTYSYDTNPAPY
jgi:hypothetical protein